MKPSVGIKNKHGSLIVTCHESSDHFWVWEPERIGDWDREFQTPNTQKIEIVITFG
jgi:hypothetical protein